MLEWNVYIENVNKRQIEIYNIFNHYSFKKDVLFEVIKSVKDDSTHYLNNRLKESIRKHLMYYFHHKCEWEIILSDFPPSENFKKEKVDVYQQVMLNFYKFYEYLLGETIFFCLGNKNKPTEKIYEEFLEYEKHRSI